MNTQHFPKKVIVREVGLRDGLQNESIFLESAAKEQLVRSLVASGVKDFELTSFVSPKAIPALADASELIARLSDLKDIHWSALVPNLKGAQRALETGTSSNGISSIVLFVSASQSHNQKNVNRTIEESLAGFEAIAKLLEGSHIQLRAAISTSFGCPFEGDLDVSSVVNIAQFFNDLGASNVSLGDTTGMATPYLVQDRISHLQKVVPDLPLTLHFHNTRGIGLVNVMSGLSMGIDQYESAIGGMGGCPFAPGASGNIATEDLCYLLNELNIEHGLDLNKLIKANALASQLIARELPAQVSKAGPRLSLTQASGFNPTTTSSL